MNAVKYLIVALCFGLLSACGGGNFSTVGLTGKTPATATKVIQTCDGGNATGATAIAPCATISGLSGGESVTVSDGSDSMTESADGTYAFAPISLASGSTGAEIIPAITFAVTASTGSGPKCTVDGGLLPGNTGINQSNLAQGGAIGEHMTLLCGMYPAASYAIPVWSALPCTNQATVIGTPDIVPVFFSSGSNSTANKSNDALFLEQFTASKVWGLLYQYGIGAAAVAAAQTITNPGFSLSPGAVVTAQDISALIQAEAGTIAPGFGANTVFVFFLPPGVSATYAYGSLSSSAAPDAAGLNGQVTVGSTTVTYALVEDTADGNYRPNSVIYEMTEIALIDALTNPSGVNGIAWLSDGPDVWLGASTGMLSDGRTESPSQGTVAPSLGTLCTNAGQVSYADITVGDILPIWSQTDGYYGDLCQPVAVASSAGAVSSTLSDPATPFYWVIPKEKSSVSGTMGGITRPNEIAIEVAPGQTVTVTVEFVSTQPLPGDVPLSPRVVAYLSNTNEAGYGPLGGTGAQPVPSGAKTLLTLSGVQNVTRPYAGSNANNGDTLQFTISASTTPFPGMYVLTLGQGVMAPIAVTNGSTWK